MTKTAIEGTGYFKISIDLFKELLRLPEEMKITDIQFSPEWRPDYPYMYVEIQHPAIVSEPSRFNKDGATELGLEYNEDGTFKDWYYIKYTTTVTEEKIYPGRNNEKLS